MFVDENSNFKTKEINKTLSKVMANTSSGVSSNNYKVRIITNLDEMNLYGPEWNRMALEAPQQLPMLSFSWVSAYFETRVKAGERWLCVMAFDEDRLIGLLPLVERKSRKFGIPIIELSAPFDWHTVAVDFLCARGTESLCMELILNKLSLELHGWHLIKLNRIPESSPTIFNLNSNENWIILREYDGPGSYLPIEGEYEAYKKGLSSNTRSNMKQAQNRLSKLPDVEYSFINNSINPSAILEEIGSIEASGWKGKSGSAFSLSESLHDFYKKLAGNLAKEGWLEWDLLRSEGDLIAGSLTIKFNRSQIGLKIAYDEEFKRCSPGHLLAEKIIERAFNSQEISELNLLSDSRWLASWKPCSRKYYNVRIYRRRILPFLLSYGPYIIFKKLKGSRLTRKIHEAIKKSSNGRLPGGADRSI